MKKVLYIFLFLLAIFSCQNETEIQRENEQIYNVKGFGENMQRLKPEIITTKEVINGLVALSIPNTIGTLDKHADFALLHFDKQGNLDVKPIVKGLPEKKSLDLYSDDENNILWVVRGKGVYFLDIESKKSGHIIVSNDGNGKIYRVFTVDPQKKILAIDFDNGPVTASQYRLFDLPNNQEIPTNPGAYMGVLFAYYNKQLLGKYWENGAYEWDLSDMIIETGKFWDDNLTKALTKFQINTWHKTKTMHLKKRILLGTGWIGKKLIYYSVRWDEKIEDVKVEPLILQVPEDCHIRDDYVLSQDGNWMKTLLSRYSGLTPDVPELVIYHVSDIYPQGLSLPIYCGYTHTGNNGAFMMHDTWGPCYVEQDADFPEKLFVYKLNDGLKILTEQAKKIIGQ
jgi:hypothetical protein